MIERQITIINKLGLHARAAAKLVNTASAHAAEVLIRKNGQEINGKSIMGVKLITNGADEQQAMEALVALIEDRFGESE